MEPNAAASAPLKLELVEDVPTAVTGRATAAEPDGPIEIRSLDQTRPSPRVDEDPFLGQAKREQGRGIVDPALWKRALDLAGGDEQAAVAPYLRARSAVLRMAHARKQAAVSARSRAAPEVAAAPVAAPEPAGAPHGRLRPPPPALKFAVASVAVLVLAIGAWMLLGDEPASPAPVGASASSAAGKQVAAAARAPAGVAPTVDPSVELAARVAALREQGNWNVLVLYANEWTRKQPDSARAWHELAAGYLRLRQVDEAFEAAKKAVALDPANAAHLRGLAEVYVALDRPDDAVTELEKALRVDGQHAPSLAQAGSLYATLGRLGEAREAFDRALALDPAHTGAACGALDVARRQGRARDAEALAKALKAADYECAAPAAPAVAAASSAAPVARPGVPRR